MQNSDLMLSSGCERTGAKGCSFLDTGIPNRHHKSYSGIHKLRWY